MLEIEEIKDNVIKYECECGIKGKCMIRPMADDKTVVFDLTCVGCGETKRLTITQGESNRTGVLTWALTVLNEKEE